jgi:hypothetical protein
MVGARRAVPVHEADGTAMVSVWRGSHYWSLAARYDSSRPKGNGAPSQGTAAAGIYALPLSAFRPLFRLGAGRGCVAFLAAERSAR